jgi:hypothetical protein
VDENEALHAEAGALADILGGVQLTNEQLLARRALCSNAQRGLVEAELRLLAERLRSAAACSTSLHGGGGSGGAAPAAGASTGSTPRDGDGAPAALLRNPRDARLLEYVAGGGSAGGSTRPSTAAASRPSTASAGGPPGTSRLGTPDVLTILHAAPEPHAGAGLGGDAARRGPAERPPTPGDAVLRLAASRPGTSRPGTSSSSNHSRPSTAASSVLSGGGGGPYEPRAVVQAVRGQLNVAGIGEVRGELRAALREERELLLADVAYLTALLDEQAAVQARARAGGGAAGSAAGRWTRGRPWQCGLLGSPDCGPARVRGTHPLTHALSSRHGPARCR